MNHVLLWKYYTLLCQLCGAATLHCLPLITAHKWQQQKSLFSSKILSLVAQNSQLSYFTSLYWNAFPLVFVALCCELNFANPHNHSGVFCLMKSSDPKCRLSILSTDAPWRLSSSSTFVLQPEAQFTDYESWLLVPDLITLPYCNACLSVPPAGICWWPIKSPILTADLNFEGITSMP